MSIERRLSIHCDGPGCQEVKGDSNHWFEVCFKNGDHGVFITKLNEVDADEEHKHFCGDACLFKGLPPLVRKLHGGVQ